MYWSLSVQNLMHNYNSWSLHLIELRECLQLAFAHIRRNLLPYWSLAYTQTLRVLSLVMVQWVEAVLKQFHPQQLLLHQSNEQNTYQCFLIQRAITTTMANILKLRNLILPDLNRLSMIMVSSLKVASMVTVYLLLRLGGNGPNTALPLEPTIS